MRTVYLAGPIAGCTNGEARSWRNDASNFLRQFNLRGADPLRDESAPTGKFSKAEDFANDSGVTLSRAIAGKNWLDVRMCDAMLAYVPLLDRPTYGTIWEIGAFYALQKPIVLVSDNPAVFNHPDIDISCSWKYEDLDEGLAKIVQLLGPYT